MKELIKFILKLLSIFKRPKKKELANYWTIDRSAPTWAPENDPHCIFASDLSTLKEGERISEMPNKIKRNERTD